MKNLQHKFTFDQATEIRKRHAAGESGPKLAKAFSISNVTIYRIINDKSYGSQILITLDDNAMRALQYEAELHQQSIADYATKLLVDGLFK